jgi:hypothetical protein
LAAANLTGATLASGVTASSLTSFGASPTISAPVINGTSTGTGVSSGNTANALVIRDGSGNFNAGTISAALTGHASLDLALTGGTMSGNIAMGGNQINNAIIGTSTPLAGTFTTLTGNNAFKLNQTSGHAIGAASPGLGWGLYHGGTISSTSGYAINWQTDASLTATANSDILQAMRITAAPVKGAFTGVTSYGLYVAGGSSTPYDWGIYVSDTSPSFFGGTLSTVGKLGYATGAGAGGAVTQITSRNTGVTLNTVTGAITLVSALNAAVSGATANSVTVTDSAVAATDVVHVVQKSGTDLYEIFVTNVAAGSFKMTFFTTGGTSTEQPVFNFAVIKGSNN